MFKIHDLVSLIEEDEWTEISGLDLENIYEIVEVYVDGSVVVSPGTTDGGKTWNGSLWLPERQFVLVKDRENKDISSINKKKKRISDIL